MSLFRRGVVAQRTGFLGATELVALDRQGRTAKSVDPTLTQALKNAAAWACIDVLSDAIARTPFDVVRKTATGARLPLASSFLDDPSGVVQPDVWFSQLAFSVLTDGNAFGQIVGLDARGWPTQIEPLDPALVVRRKVIAGVPTVEIDRKPHELWPLGDILHIPGRMVPAGQPWGLSPLEFAARSIGTSLAAEDFSRGYFDGGGHPSSIISTDERLDDEQAKAIKRAFLRATEGREPAVLGSGLTYEQIQTDPKDSQFLELMQFEVLQACRFWRVPPSLAYAAVQGQNVTYANVTDADLQYLKHSLDGYLVRFEGALTRCTPRPQFVRANRNAILRMDAERRHRVYDMRLKNRTVTVNEVRSLEDESPFDDPEFSEPGIPPFAADVVAPDLTSTEGN